MDPAPRPRHRAIPTLEPLLDRRRRYTIAQLRRPLSGMSLAATLCPDGGRMTIPHIRRRTGREWRDGGSQVSPGHVSAQSLALAERHKMLDAREHHRKLRKEEKERIKARVPVHPCTRVLDVTELNDHLVRMGSSRSYQLYVDKHPQCLSGVAPGAPPLKLYQLRRPESWTHNDVCDFLVSVPSVRGQREWTDLGEIVRRENILGMVLMVMQPKDHVALGIATTLTQACDIFNSLQSRHLTVSSSRRKVSPWAADCFGKYLDSGEASLHAVRAEFSRRNRDEDLV